MATASGTSPGCGWLLEEVLSRDTAIEDFEVEHDFETIGRRTMLLNARRLRSVAGATEVIFLAMEDVTEQRRLREREQAARAEAEQAARAKDHFLAILSHELRTPLSAMLGWARMLRAGKLDDTVAAKALAAIERNTLVQARLIEDLLDVSRIVTDTLRLDLRTIMVAPAVEAAITVLKPAADAKGVRLESHLDAAAGPVRGDAIRLQQVVSNLVSNAINGTLSGGLVEIHLARRDAGVEIRVRDTGKGIAADRLATLFTRFANVPSGSHTQGGLGLGLAIVHRVVELHGGTVRAESAGPGHGATFTVTLPLGDGRPIDDADAYGLPAVRLPTLDAVRVLVVEDDADTRDLFTTILEDAGAGVTVAASVEAALQALDQALPDVLVSDIGMPGQDGYALMRKMAEAGRRLPALALTALARIEDRERVMAAGYQMYLAKPIEPADLVAAVATLAGRAEPTRPS